MCFTTGNSYSKGRSPWNFFEDFENEKVGRLRTNKFTTNDKGTGRKPFKIRKDPDGNQYLEVTVKDGWNVDQKGREKETTERAEFQVKPKKALGKEIWISFKKRLPEDFTHIDDRVLFFQFKNQHDPMKRSPLLGIRFYKNGNSLKIGGDTGGNASKNFRQKGSAMSSSEVREEKYIHRIGAKYKNKGGDWFVRWEKDREDDKNKDRDDLRFTTNNASVTQLGEWSTYKIGIYNTRGKDGFVKVYKDNELMFDYKGITYDWSGPYDETCIRVGAYRDSGKQFGIEYPDQIIHFDDFIVVSDENTLDQLIRKNEKP
jgi:hypothetical protein